MRILFWLSGILWNVRGVGIDWLQTALLFNPITFFVEGFRGALIYHQWFWEDWRSLVGFTVTFGLISVLAVLVFKRTRKELVDIL